MPSGVSLTSFYTYIQNNWTYKEQYATWFVLVYIKYWLILLVSIWLIKFILLRLQKWRENKNANLLSHNSSVHENKELRRLESNRSEDNPNLTQDSLNESKDLNVTNMSNQPLFLRAILILAYWVAWILFAFALCILSGIGVINTVLNMFILFAVMLIPVTWTLYQTCPKFVFKGRKGFKLFQKVLTTQKTLRSKTITCMLISITLFSITLPWLTYKTCMVDHVDGIFPYGNLSISSAFLRYLYLDKACPEGAPCQVYVTVPFEASKQAFLNVHTHTSVTNVTVLYDLKTNSDNPQNVAYSTYIQPDALDSTAERNIHAALIKDLQADTEYFVGIYYGGKFQKNYTYLTPPDESRTDPYNVVYGGDLGVSNASDSLNKELVKYDPRVIFVGGDFAYDDGDPACSFVMDNLLNSFTNNINKPLNRLVPSVFAIGNHEIGYNSLSEIDNPTTVNGPSYVTYFPQHLPNDTNGNLEERVPTISERRAYNSHIVGDIVTYQLDTGYLNSYHSGPQMQWLLEDIALNADKIKISQYHNPIFSACFLPGSYANFDDSIYYGLAYWTPVFEDPKNRFISAFENHEHQFKRTFPIKGQKVDDEDGVVYLGDGCWGVNPSPCPTIHNDTGIYAKAGTGNHLWILGIDPAGQKINYTAIDPNGKSMDEFIQDYSKKLNN